MSRAVVRGGKWVRENGVELNQIHNQLSRINEFAHGVTKLTHTKIEILSHILDARPDQERAILKILSMDKATINALI